MKKTVFLFLIASMMLFSCNTNNAETEQKSYELTKESLLLKEQKNPAGFLKVVGNNRKNIIGQTVIKGSVTNQATIAIYKDIEVKLSFFSKTKTLLETDKETIFEQLGPGQAKEFKTKYFAPKGTDSVALEILTAKVVGPTQ